MVKFLTRSELGLREPRSFSRNISPDLGGCAVHWGGPAPTINSHADCVRTWRQWQDFHMDERGWVDIAYTMGFCQHGYVFAGRGYGVRTAANGTNDGNQRFYAFVWIGGQGQQPTQAALDALDWCIAEARRNGSAGREVRPHALFTGSQCPGYDLTVHARSRHLQDVSSITEEEYEMKRGDTGPGVQLIQGCYNKWAKITNRQPIADKAGVFGQSTEEAIKTYQGAAKIAVTGRVDGVTAAFLLRYERV